jgi:hypothetical protein
VYSYHANTMPGSNAYSGRARGLMINFHAESRPKPSVRMCSLTHVSFLMIMQKSRLAQTT